MAQPDSELERDLAARIADGDVAAFDEVFRVLLSPVVRYVHRYVRSWEVAEDLTQGVFLQLWVRLRQPELSPIRNVKAYLYNAARCDALDYLKRQRIEARHRHVSAAPDAHAQIELAEWEEEAASRERIAALQRAVDTLPPRQREILLLRLKRATYQDIASTLNVSVKTVDSHLQRAFAALRSTLRQFLS